jgi:hypothetical protein
MSTAAFVEVHNQSVIAWETDGQIWMSTLERNGPPGKPQAPPGSAKGRKHPALAFNGRGILLAWTEGMGWNRGGKVAWQLYDSDLKTVDAPSGLAARGEADGVPAWSLVAAVPLSDERFLIFY